MTEDNKNLPNLKIRTMQSDLKSLEENGGDFTLSKEISLKESDFIKKVEENKNIKPPELDVNPSPGITFEAEISPTKIGTVEQIAQAIKGSPLFQAEQKKPEEKNIFSSLPKFNAPPKTTPTQESSSLTIEKASAKDFLFELPKTILNKKQTKEKAVKEDTRSPEEIANQRLLLVLGSILIVILAISASFWYLYPILNKPKPTPETSPSPTAVALTTPSPSPIAPVISFKKEIEKSAVNIKSLDPEEFLQQMKIKILLPQATGTIISFEPQKTSGEYYSGSELIQAISPASLSSFKNSISERYAIIGSWHDGQAFLSLILSFKPEYFEAARSIIKSWETANIESYFPIVFLPQNPELRRTEVFKNVIIGKIPARQIIINGQKFIYAIIKNQIVMTSSEKAFEVIADNLE